MSDPKPNAKVADREWILAELARRDAGDALSSERTLGEADLVTIHNLQAQLETLVADLRRAPPVDDFAEESGCRRATELAELAGEASGFFVEQPNLDRIGPYQVVGKISRGGMGTVYKAIHLKLNRIVAIKVLPANRLQDAAAIARFEREMKAIGGLAHRHIVAATDAGEVDGMQYLVMEYVDGLDLSTLVRRVGPLSPADACEIVRQAAEGLQDAHDRGVIHRDVKPSNLMLTDGGHAGADTIVKILDFGLARLSPNEPDPAELTMAGQMMGTLRYMSPEQCANSSDVDGRADIYSLGATLYRLLTGEAPFADARFDSPMALVAALANESPVPIATRRTDLPRALVAVVERMLARNPADRFATPSAVAEALGAYTTDAALSDLLQQGRSTSLPMSTVRIDGATALRGERVAAARSNSSPTTINRRGFFFGGGILLCAAAAFFAWRHFAGDRPQQVVADAELLERNRHAVEWLSSINARFSVLTPEQQSVLVNAGDPLPAGALQLQSIDLNQQAKIHDEDMARLRGLTLLQMLALSFTNIGDDGLLRIGPLPELQNLFLVGAPVTDRGLAILSTTPKLTSLYLANTHITDEGLKSVSMCKRLNELALTGCPITDAGLKELRGLAFLRVLDVQNTKVTFDGIAELESVLPNCSIKSNVNDAKRGE